MHDNYASASFPPPREFQDTAHNALRDGVRDVFGVTLEPEPVLVGCSL